MEIVKLLMENNADVTIMNKEEQTPLQTASDAFSNIFKSAK